VPAPRHRCSSLTRLNLLFLAGLTAFWAAAVAAVVLVLVHCAMYLQYTGTAFWDGSAVPMDVWIALGATIFFCVIAVPAYLAASAFGPLPAALVGRMSVEEFEAAYGAALEAVPSALLGGHCFHYGARAAGSRSGKVVITAKPERQLELASWTNAEAVGVESHELLSNGRTIVEFTMAVRAADDATAAALAAHRAAFRDEHSRRDTQFVEWVSVTVQKPPRHILVTASWARVPVLFVAVYVVGTLLCLGPLVNLWLFLSVPTRQVRVVKNFTLAPRV